LIEEIDKLIAKAREQRRREEFQGALETIEKALKITEELPEDQRREKKGEVYDMKGRILYHMGKQYEDRAKIEKAFEINEKAIELRASDLTIVGYAYSMWQRFIYSRALGKKVDVEKIRISQKRAYQVALVSGDLQRVGDFSHNLAFLLQIEAEEQIDPDRKRVKFEEAIIEYRKALLFRQLAGDKRGQAMTLDQQAECCLKLALLNLTEATKIYEERGDKEGLRRVEERKRYFLSSLSKYKS